jgi:hypothetical protein
MNTPKETWEELQARLLEELVQTTYGTVFSERKKMMAHTLNQGLALAKAEGGREMLEKVEHEIVDKTIQSLMFLHLRTVSRMIKKEMDDTIATLKGKECNCSKEQNIMIKCPVHDVRERI